MLLFLVYTLFATPVFGTSGQDRRSAAAPPAQRASAGKSKQYQSFFARYAPSMRAFYLADCFNPRSQFYKKKECQEFKRVLVGLHIQVQPHCLNLHSRIYYTKSCDSYRMVLYGRLQIAPPKVKLRPEKKVVREASEVCARPRAPVSLPFVSLAKPLTPAPFPKHFYGFKIGGISPQPKDDTNFVSFSFSYMWTKTVGLELAVEGSEDFEGDDGYDVFLLRASLSLTWALLGGSTKGQSVPVGYQLFIRGGIMAQGVYSENPTDTTPDTSKNALFGAGIVLYFNELISLSSEVQVITRSFAQRTGRIDRLHKTSGLIRVDLGVHFTNPLWFLVPLSIPVGFF